MWLTKCFVAFVALFGRTCLAKIMIEIEKPNRFASLQETTIELLTTCYRNRDKTAVVLGDYPGNFIERLSSHRTFSLVLMDDNRRAVNHFPDLWATDMKRMHKVHLVVSISSYFMRSSLLLAMFRRSTYANSMASVIIVKWSRERKYNGCASRAEAARIFSNAKFNDLLNVNIVCSSMNMRTLVYGYNPFVEAAPKPWRLDVSLKNHIGTDILSIYVQRYPKDVRMCKNLDFDKTRDLGGMTIDAIYWCWEQQCFEYQTESTTRKWEWIEQNKHLDFIPKFFEYVNATMNRVWINVVTGQLDDDDRLSTRPMHLRGVGSHRSYTLAHGTNCKFLLTRFRGYKSQLEKIFSIIDDYSWIAMVMVYIVTLMFFKFFLRQSLLPAVLNLVRLTCNCGLVTLPPNVAPQIYLSCLFMFVVTMQGIFSGNLASLLTHNFTVRQVDSIRDVAELGYTVYVEDADLIHFDDPAFKGRIMKKLINEECIPHVLRNSQTACLTWGAYTRELASEANLHTSLDCVATEYITHNIPWKWSFEEKLNNYLGILLGGGIMMPLEAAALERRLMQNESIEIELVPKVMTLRDLGFAFALLGIGLAFASVAFVVEIIVYRCRRRVTTTRVIALN